MAETKVDPEQLREIGKKIGDILEDHESVFNKLTDLEPNAGEFDAAVWLEDLFADRRDAILAHVKYLQLAFDEINTGLHQIATDFEAVDGSNADALAKFETAGAETVKGMGDAEFTPEKVKEKDTYESGDDDPAEKPPVDLSVKDPKLPGEVEELPEFEDWMKELPDGKDEDEDKDDPPKKKDDPPANTGENFDPWVEPGDDDWKRSGDVEVYKEATYRYYEIDGEQQTDENGTKIWWTNKEPYTRNGATDFVPYKR